MFSWCRHHPTVSVLGGHTINGIFYIFLTGQIYDKHTTAVEDCRNIAVHPGRYELVKFESSTEVTNVRNHLATIPGKGHDYTGN